MLLHLLKSKLHMAAVTETELHYHGSVTIDRELMDAIGLLPYEKVLIANCENGQRAESYVIEGPPGSKVVKMNGALAHTSSIGDRVIIIAFVSVTEEESRKHDPRVAILNEQNEIIDQFIGEIYPQQGSQTQPLS
ncbi:Aspartate 1-decarboxylase precursor [Thalassoglobus neptunius]|uniref:Aspartate 1-decarboxylase n=1 Tax=Thalassoglobus neptunius TaxID=1938619 RepID=A0A5C5X440_9PLAN|nr:aspartate 1-decarboxylase [Thalassoglobus neptunius]TWT57349.1 Aspartate 1-decarboxylase precursor [Thalassoglobus neptunius]